MNSPVKFNKAVVAGEGLQEQATDQSSSLQLDASALFKVGASCINLSIAHARPFTVTHGRISGHDALKVVVVKAVELPCFSGR